jgi:uncharacterized protein
MSLIKLLIVFGIIIIVMGVLKKNIMYAVVAASVGAVLLYGLSPSEAGGAVWTATKSWTTIEALLVFYCITFLQRMMEARKDLSNCQVALNGLFNNRRINSSIVPFILGCLPAASTILICGPIVRESVGDSLKTEEKAAVTAFFRHISELFLPTYTSIFIAIGLTEGQVTVSSFVIAMIPMALALFASGWLVYLRRVPKDTGMKSDKPKSYYWKLLAKSVWAIMLAIALILIFNMNVEIAVLICIVIDFFVNKFIIKEILPFFKTAFEGKLMLSTYLVMVFKEILSTTGVISQLPDYFAKLPIPQFLIFAMIFFFGSIIAGNQAMNVLCIPMMMATLGGASALPLFILIMSMGYAAMQISPIHICLTLCSEDYKISLGTLVAKVMPMVGVFVVLSFAYYGILTFIC